MAFKGSEYLIARRVCARASTPHNRPRPSPIGDRPRLIPSSPLCMTRPTRTPDWPRNADSRSTSDLPTSLRGSLATPRATGRGDARTPAMPAVARLPHRQRRPPCRHPARAQLPAVAHSAQHARPRYAHSACRDGRTFLWCAHR